MVLSSTSCLILLIFNSSNCILNNYYIMTLSPGEQPGETLNVISSPFSKRRYKAKYILKNVAPSYIDFFSYSLLLVNGLWLPCWNTTILPFVKVQQEDHPSPCNKAGQSNSPLKEWFSSGALDREPSSVWTCAGGETIDVTHSEARTRYM
jgi:hypothetical protein